MIGEFHAEKCDYRAICWQFSYLLADNSINCMLSLRCLFVIVLRAICLFRPEMCNKTMICIRFVICKIIIIGASLSEPHCYVANRGKRNALWCVRTRNFSTVIKVPSACDRNFYQFVVNLPIVFPSSQLLRQFA